MSKSKPALFIGQVVAIVAALATCLTSCLPDYMPSRHLRRPLAATELFGTWTLTQESTFVLAKMGLSVPDHDGRSIVFQQSGKCLFHSYSQQAERFVWAEGKWQLQYSDSVDRNRKANLIEIELDILNARGKKAYEPLYVSETNGMLTLWHYLGDADSRVFVGVQKATVRC